MAVKRTKPKSEPPSAGYVMDLWRMKTQESDEARLIRLAWEFRRLTKMTHTLRIPTAYQAIAKEVRTPFVRDTWHRAVAALNQKPYVIHIEPRDHTIDSRKAAAIGEQWDTAVRESLDKEIGMDTSIESAKALIRDGESVLKIVHRPDAWATFPKRTKAESADDYLKGAEKYKKGSPLPFAWRIVDRLTTCWQDGEFGDEWVIELGSYPRAFMARRYGMTRHATEDRLVDPANPSMPVDPQNWKWTEQTVNPENTLGGMPKPWGWQSSPFGYCTKAEFFDDEWWSVVIDGTMAPGWPKPNPYAPFLPLLRAKGPDSESLLYSMMFLVPALDELLTMKLNWSHLGAYPNPVVHALPNAITGAFPTGEDGIAPKLEWKPGQLLTFPAGWTIDFLQPPPVGQDINQLVTIFQTLIDIAGIPSVFRGVGGADQAGYAVNQLMAAASLAFRLASESLSRQFGKGFELLHYLVPNLIQQEVPVLAGAGLGETGKQWVALKPGSGHTSTVAGVEELGPVDIKFRAMLPTDEQARAMIGIQLVNAPKPLMSQRQAIEKYLQEEDPDRILDEIAVEEALRQQPLQQLVLDEALKEAGITSTTPGGDQPPGGGQPPGPEGAPPGINDAANAGEASVPGLNQPMQPAPPAPPGGAGAPGGRPAGAFPGLPPRPSAAGGP